MILLLDFFEFCADHVPQMLLFSTLLGGRMSLPIWYKMKKVQVEAFGRVPEGEKYKNGTTRTEDFRKKKEPSPSEGFPRKR